MSRAPNRNSSSIVAVLNLCGPTRKIVTGCYSHREMMRGWTRGQAAEAARSRGRLPTIQRPRAERWDRQIDTIALTAIIVTIWSATTFLLANKGCWHGLPVGEMRFRQGLESHAAGRAGDEPDDRSPPGVHRRADNVGIQPDLNKVPCAPTPPRSGRLRWREPLAHQGPARRAPGHRSPR
jgi:hypothetical protein